MLEGHFSQFGPLTDSVVLEDNGVSRGFGFVTYLSPEMAEVVERMPHVIDGRMVDVKKAEPKGGKGEDGGLHRAPGPMRLRAANVPVRPARPPPEDEKRRIFVGGLPREATEEMLIMYFSNFGSIAGCEIMRQDGHSRGFGFVTFAAAEEAARALAQPSHIIEGKAVSARTCHPKGELPPPPRGAGGAGGQGPPNTYGAVLAQMAAGVPAGADAGLGGGAMGSPITPSMMYASAQGMAYAQTAMYAQALYAQPSALYAMAPYAMAPAAAAMYGAGAGAGLYAQAQGAGAAQAADPYAAAAAGAEAAPQGAGLYGQGPGGSGSAAPGAGLYGQAAGAPLSQPQGAGLYGQEQGAPGGQGAGVGSYGAAQGVPASQGAGYYGSASGAADAQGYGQAQGAPMGQGASLYQQSAPGDSGMQGMSAGSGMGMGMGMSAGSGMGMGQGMSTGGGMGMGQGMGTGSGMGMGQGMGSGGGMGMGSLTQAPQTYQDPGLDARSGYGGGGGMAAAQRYSPY